MNFFTNEFFLSYLSLPQLEINIIILINVSCALLLGMLVGYERSFHGRAAGMRTYGLVCMSSSALVVIVGFPQHWYGGLLPLTISPDPTRVIQGIVTGIGFLGTGVIMKEGLNISGLTTAASIWAACTIGILCGAGFYLAAIMLALIASTTMIWGGRIENILPSRHAISVIFHFKVGYKPNSMEINRFVDELGLSLGEGSVNIYCHEDHQEWHMVLVAKTSQKLSVLNVAAQLQNCNFLSAYQIGFARN